MGGEMFSGAGVHFFQIVNNCCREDHDELFKRPSNRVCNKLYPLQNELDTLGSLAAQAVDTLQGPHTFMRSAANVALGKTSVSTYKVLVSLPVVRVSLRCVASAVGAGAISCLLARLSVSPAG